MSKTRTFNKSLLVLAIMSIMLFAMTITASAASMTTIKQTGDSTTSVDIKWNTSLGEHYKVYVSEKKNSGYIRVNGNSSSYDDLGTGEQYIYGLQAGRTYYVKVESLYEDEHYDYHHKAWSKPFQIVTSPEDVDRDSIKQTAGTSKYVSVKWSKVSGATGYKVGLEDGKSKKVTSTKTTLSASVGNRYYVEVTAYKKSSSGYVAYSGKTTSHGVFTSPKKPYNVAKASEKNLTWKPNNSSNVTVEWDAEYDYTYSVSEYGYQMQLYSVDGKKITTVKNIKETYYKITSAKICRAIKNKGFKIRVRSYAKNDGIVVYSAWSPITTVIPQASVKISLKSRSTAKVTWPKVANATKYIVYVSRNSGYTDSGNWSKKTVSAKTRSYTIKNLKPYDDFGVYVIPVVKVKGKTYKATKTFYDYSYTKYYY